MGAFINVLVVQNRSGEAVRNALEALGDNPAWNLIPGQCRYQERGGGVSVLLSDMCSGYDAMTQELSKELACPVMLCYIYDGDFWGYFFFDSGEHLDAFMPMPYYFEEMPEEEQQRVKGNSRLIAERFNVKEEDVAQYLRLWTEQDLNGNEPGYAYPDDEFSIGEDWQMADFMRAIGHPYDW